MLKCYSQSTPQYLLIVIDFNIILWDLSIIVINNEEK